MADANTIAAIATPPGTGGIAVVRLSGRASTDIAAKVFVPKNTQKTLKSMPGYTAAYGSFLDGEGVEFDTGVALVFRAPHSYTGEDVVELSCHGGSQVSGQLLRACLRAGAAPAGPGEFTKRAVLNGRMDLSQAEAVIDLISANSRQAVALAGETLRGRMAAQIGQVKQSLVALAGHLAAYVDYPEEDVDELSAENFLATVDAAKQQIATLLQGYDKGQMVRRGIKVAIVGSPNVGKSTLFNLLAGEDRAIVTAIAGTTRDVVEQTVQMGGIPLILSDTAGLHETQDIVESEGIRRSYAQLQQAGLVIAVFDGSQPVIPQDIALAKQCAGRPALALVNKADLSRLFDETSIEPYFSRCLTVSAEKPQDYEKVEQAVLGILGLNHLDPDALLLANDRQLTAAASAHAALINAGEALRAGYTLDAAGVCLDDALIALAQLTGEDASEGVINDVFSRFCVGK